MAMTLISSSENDWKDRSVLVTGCTGLLGTALTCRLVEQGANVVGIIRDHVPRSPLFLDKTAQQITAISGDIRDQKLIERVLSEYEIDVVFHLAAQALVGVANRNPAETLDVNIRGTWIILEAVRRQGNVKSVVVASSDKAYGASANLPYTEDTPLRGHHPYDVSKSCADLIAQSYVHSYGLSVGITRCGNLYGGGDLNWNRIIPGTIRSALEGKAPLIRSDGTSTRDYLYIDDAVNGYLQFARQLAEAKLDGQALNFGNNQPLSVLELVIEILDICGRSDLRPVILNEANNEIAEQYLDSSRASALLNWSPQHTLREGLNKTLQWYQKYFSFGG